jgi:hypothetical protein
VWPSGWPWSSWGLLRRYHTLQEGKIHASSGPGGPGGPGTAEAQESEFRAVTRRAGFRAGDWRSVVIKTKRLPLRLRLEYHFPIIWAPTLESRDRRQLLWHRHRLVQMRTRIMNQQQAVAMNEGKRRKERGAAAADSSWRGTHRGAGFRADHLNWDRIWEGSRKTNETDNPVCLTRCCL